MFQSECLTTFNNALDRRSNHVEQHVEQLDTKAISFCNKQFAYPESRRQYTRSRFMISLSDYEERFLLNRWENIHPYHRP